MKEIAKLVQNDVGLFLVFDTNTDLEKFVEDNPTVPVHVVCFGQYENALSFNFKQV